MTREETPLQAAKRLGLPYVRIVIDRRHLKGGKIDLEGPASESTADDAHKLLRTMLEE